MGLSDDTRGKSKKKKKKQKNVPALVPLVSGSFPYHPEEEYIDKLAKHVHEYSFKSAPPRDDEAFGVEQFGRLVVIERDRLTSAVESLEAASR